MEHLPFDLSEGEYTPVLREFSGWKRSLADSFRSDEVPAALEDYINFIVDKTGVPISLVSFGPDRAQVYQTAMSKI
jgi:adenylosuccinate synthase